MEKHPIVNDMKALITMQFNDQLTQQNSLCLGGVVHSLGSMCRLNFTRADTLIACGMLTFLMEKDDIYKVFFIPKKE